MFRILDSVSAQNLKQKCVIRPILDLEKQLRDANVKLNSTTYEHILSAYSKSNKYNEITKLLSRMEAEGIKPENSFFEKALKLAARFGNSTLQALILNYMELNGIQKTSKTYRYLFSCMRENMELERAMATFTEMKEKNLDPSLNSYVDIIHLAAIVKQPVIAFNLLQAAKRSKEFKTHDEFLYLEVLRVAACQGEYGILKTSWKDCVQKGFKPDEGTCLYVLNVAAKHSDPTLARSVMEYLGKNEYTYRECHFILLIEAFSSKGDMKATFELFHIMRKVGIIPNKKTISPLISVFLNDSNIIEKAKYALHQLASTTPEKLEVSAFNLVIHVLATRGEYDNALSVFDQMCDLKLKPNDETLDAILDVCIHDQNVPLGKALYKDLISNGVKKTPSIMSKMITLMCTSDDYEEAFNYLEEAKSLGMIPYRGSYFKLVKILATAKDPRLSIALDDMEAYGYKLSAHLYEYIEKAQNQQEESYI